MCLYKLLRIRCSKFSDYNLQFVLVYIHTYVRTQCTGKHFHPFTSCTNKYFLNVSISFGISMIFDSPYKINNPRDWPCMKIFIFLLHIMLSMVGVKRGGFTGLQILRMRPVCIAPSIDE